VTRLYGLALRRSNVIEGDNTVVFTHIRKKQTLIGGLGAAGIMIAGVVTASAANAHGYVSGPYSRAQACKIGLNSDCGSIIYEPQSLEALKGFPAGGPADGQIASAGGQFGGNLDAQSATRWYKNDISTGAQTFSWTFTAPHRTAQWRYYMTKQGWDPNAALSRHSLEEIAVIEHDGTAASTNPSHTVNIPADRTGYHAVLAVWDIADTVNAFYNVIDVNVTGHGVPAPTPTPTPTPVATPTPTPTPNTTAPDTTAPSAPMHLHSMGTTESSVSLMWGAATDNVGVTGYRVYRNGTQIAQVTGTIYNSTGLNPGTSYSYTVRAVDAAGNVSTPSNTLTISTQAAPAPAPAPTATAWNSRSAYTLGDVVTYQGATYRCIQSYQGWGDPNWILAPSLWTRI